jgi:hypothetical protein
VAKQHVVGRSAVGVLVETGPDECVGFLGVTLGRQSWGITMDDSLGGRLER